MPAITAQTINQLRQQTGLGMNKCKEVMQQADGDIAVALEILKKEGVKASIAARATSEGRVHVARSADGRTGAAVEILCNTDFTARSESIQKLLTQATDKLIADPSADLANDAEIKDALVAVAQATGENVTLGRAKVLTNPAGKVGTYFYSVTGKIAVLVSVAGNPSDELLNDVALHVTAFKPTALGLTREAVPADQVAKEKDLAIEAAKATGKPQNIAEKIAEGKMNAFFKERVLGEQDFINGDKFKGSVNEMLKQAGVQLVDYVRLEVGVA
jgi:elongation factor Ts